MQLLDDVVTHLLRGGGGEGGDGAVGEERAKLGELPIFGAEVVAPLGNAVSFVNCEERERHILEPSFGARHDRTFGGDVDEAELAREGFLFEFAAIGPENGAIEEDGGDAHLAELCDLILHEGDERRDDDGGAFFIENSRELITERFTAARGHNDADVAAGIESLDNRFLTRAEGCVAPKAVKRKPIAIQGRSDSDGGGHGRLQTGVGRPAPEVFAFYSHIVKWKFCGTAGCGGADGDGDSLVKQER